MKSESRPIVIGQMKTAALCEAFGLNCEVHTEMRAMKRGMLKSGCSGKKVKNKKQAIAI